MFSGKAGCTILSVQASEAKGTPYSSLLAGAGDGGPHGYRPQLASKAHCGMLLLLELSNCHGECLGAGPRRRLQFGWCQHVCCALRPVQMWGGEWLHGLLKVQRSKV